MEQSTTNQSAKAKGNKQIELQGLQISCQSPLTIFNMELGTLKRFKWLTSKAQSGFSIPSGTNRCFDIGYGLNGLQR